MEQGLRGFGDVLHRRQVDCREDGDVREDARFLKKNGTETMARELSYMRELFKEIKKCTHATVP